jgi:hypothetical protein
MSNWLGWSEDDLRKHQARIKAAPGRIIRPMDKPAPNPIAKVKEMSEHQSQVAVCEWWAFICTSYSLPEFALYAVPNGGKRAIKTATNLKAEGVRAGIPDLFLAAKSGRDTTARGLYLEMKRRPNKCSPEQVAVIDYLRRAGYHCVVAWNSDEAIRAIKEYLAHSTIQQEYAK